MRTGSDPITEDEAELDARADEDAREQRWVKFVNIVKVQKAACQYWSDVIEEANNALFLAEYDESCDWGTSLAWTPPRFEKACTSFGHTEGWDGVFSAIARAMREQAKS